jgi:hypothetical protein
MLLSSFSRRPSLTHPTSGPSSHVSANSSSRGGHIGSDGAQQQLLPPVLLLCRRPPPPPPWGRPTPRRRSAHAAGARYYNSPFRSAQALSRPLVGARSSHSRPPPSSDNYRRRQTPQKNLARSGHLWRTPAERRGPAALRQWLLCQLLTQARLRQPSACPWNPVLTQRDRAPFRRNLARDLIFTQPRSSRGRQRRDDGVSSKFPVCHGHCNYPQLPT